MVETLAYMLAEVEALTLGDSLGDAHAVMDPLNDTLAEVECNTLGDTLGDTQTLVDTLA